MSVLHKKVLKMQIDFLMLSCRYKLLRRYCPWWRTEVLRGGSHGKEGIEKINKWKSIQNLNTTNPGLPHPASHELYTPE